MVAYPTLREGVRHRGEEDPHSGFQPFAAVVETPASPVWALPGLEARLSTGESFMEPAVRPLVLVGYEPRDGFFQLMASVEGAPREAAQRCAPVDPGAESGERELRVSPWITEVAARFAQLLALPRDWDGHGAGSTAPANVLAAGRFLAAVMAPSTPAPTVVPTSDGGLQLEWHRAGLDVELLFGEEDPPLLYVADVDSGREWEGAPVEGFAEFDLAQRLRG